MTHPASPGPAGAETRGVVAQAMRLFSSLTRHLQSLVALAGLEGREAVGLYVRAAIALGVALFCAAFGYVFLILAVAFALDRFLHVDWIWIASGFAVLHLLGAAIAGFLTKKFFTTPVFRGTAEEIRRDVAALHSAGATTGTQPPLM
ncbi:MAG TPA: phage holin family protein [Chthoniobacterales bacterium]